jgi:hypothetical protein
MRKWFLIGAFAVAVIVPATLARAQSPEEKAMAHSIAMQLKESGRLQNYRIGVKYEDGVAWLMGNVANEEQFEMAMELTKQMEGVDHVVSKLEISGQEAAEKPVAENGGDFESALKLASAEADRRQQLQKSKQQPKLVSPQAERSGNSSPKSSRSNGKSSRTNKPNANRQNVGLLSKRFAGNAQPMPPRSMQAQQAAYEAQAGYHGQSMQMQHPGGAMPIPAGHSPGGSAVGVSYDNANMPGYAWPSYASYPNYSAVTYPRQYSPSAWPYIGPFYPYPQVPLGWRKVTLEWDDGWWFLDFSDSGTH